jgi:hypothetical protein
MKTHTNRIPAVVSICVASFVRVVAPLYAFQYCRAAQRDERNGFPFAAAMEWHKAAELFAPVAPPLADRCWQEWERIVRLPRRLAGPLVAKAKVVPLVAQSDSRIFRKLAA